MTRAMFGVTSSPFLLGGTLQHHLSKYEDEDPEIVKKLLESFYVDDFKSGEENVDQASDLSCLVIRIKTRKIMLGHPYQDTQTEGEQKVLRLFWNTKEDTLVFRFGHLIKLAKELPATKRSVIKVIVSVYDPIGFISPFVIPMKILFQDLCSEKED